MDQGSRPRHLHHPQPQAGGRGKGQPRDRHGGQGEEGRGEWSRRTEPGGLQQAGQPQGQFT